jgi:two-component system NtrC family sensor kinase
MTDNSNNDGKKRRAFKRRLAFRFGVWLWLGGAVILLVVGMWNIRQQRDHMTELIRVSANRSAETILRSTRSAMMRNHPEEIHQILEPIAHQPGIERLRIFDKQGRIYVSSFQEEVGTIVPMSAEQCFVCHQKDAPLQRLDMRDRFRTFDKDGESVLGVITPIRNEPDCSSAPCHAHPPEKRVLGVLDVQLSLNPVDRQVAASERTLGAGLIVLVVAVALLAGFLTWRMVLKPIRRFTDAAARVAAGDLSASIPVTSSDEIGEMTASWNRMLDELSRARQDLENWSQTLEQRVAEKTRELELAHQRILVVEKMASLGKLAAVMAHEINNPLTGISTYARLLTRKLEGKGGAGQDQQAADEETGKILHLVEKEAQRCGDIVRNLLLFSRSPGARFSEEDLGTLLDRCRLLVNHKAELQGVEVRCEVAPGVPKVVCDPSQIQQMVLALAINGIEAMPTGGTLTIRLGPADDDDAVILSVIDTGGGIAPEIKDHIFEPFFTTKDQVKGVGLGLAVVYGIVNRHHGQIAVESEPDSGAVFTITLPRRQPPGEDGKWSDLVEEAP